MNPPILTLNNPVAPRLSPELAQEIGLNESILLLQIEFWIRTSTTDEHEGRRWTYQSTSDIQEFFPFWSSSTIKRTIQSLINKKLLHIGNYNKYRYDRTRWFALNEAGLKHLKSIHLQDSIQNGPRSDHIEPQSVQNEPRSAHNVPTIPEITTESTNKDDGSTGTAATTSIFSLYGDNIGRITPVIASELRQAEKEFPYEWIRDAIEEAVLANVRRWNYVRAILNRWKVEGREERREFQKGTRAGRKRSGLMEWMRKEGILSDPSEDPRDQCASAVDVTPRP